MSNIITVDLSRGRKVETSTVFQWNHGMTLRFIRATLPENFRVDFSNSTRGKAKSMIGSASNGVVIPDEYFMPGSTIYAWIVLFPTENSAVAEWQISIPIDPKAKDTDEEPNPQQESVIDQAINALNTAVAEAQEAITHYPKVVDGYWYVWDVTAGEYVTTGVKSTGEDGFSPIVTISSITGGHRVTITDADGDHVFDVMDGEPGQPGYSPTASVSKSGKTATITITDQQGTTTATVTDGENGQPGPGVPAGGTTGQVPKKKSDADYDLEWGDEPSVPVQDVQVNGTSILNNGVANVPIAGDDLGVVRIESGYGITKNSAGRLYIGAAGDGVVKFGADSFAPIVPLRQHISVFYGLAKAAGADDKASNLPIGQYTGAAKSAIAQMLDAPETVSGSTPSIAAKAGVRYICGECATLDITTPASGIVDVVFTSGSTPTVLTVTPPTGMTMKWANGFDPTSLDANTTYEINIADGLGVAVGWT